MDELDRLFRHVVRAVRDARPEYLTQPFEVAELLELVPYKAVRAEVGVETNDDYAHAVTRLLAGERGYLFADDLLQDDLRTELASPNPDLAAYRSYANARVTLSQEQMRKALEELGPPAAAPSAGAAAATPATPATPATRTTAARPAAPRRATASPPRPPSTGVPRPLDPDAEAPKRASRPGCRYCGQPLPEEREVHYCPSCGQNLLVRRCAACSAELDAGWKFCVACGRAAAS